MKGRHYIVYGILNNIPNAQWIVYPIYVHFVHAPGATIAAPNTTTPIRGIHLADIGCAKISGHESGVRTCPYSQNQYTQLENIGRHPYDDMRTVWWRTCLTMM